jgi:hypothetical protein
LNWQTSFRVAVRENTYLDGIYLTENYSKLQSFHWVVGVITLQLQITGLAKIIQILVGYEDNFNQKDGKRERGETTAQSTSTLEVDSFSKHFFT